MSHDRTPRPIWRYRTMGGDPACRIALSRLHLFFSPAYSYLCFLWHGRGYWRLKVSKA
jgi:hypothetical protein